MPPEAKKVATQELERLQQMPPAMAEYGVTRHYLDWIINLPWTRKPRIKLTWPRRNAFSRNNILADQGQGPPAGVLAVIKLKQKLKGPFCAWSATAWQNLAREKRSRRLGRKFARISLGGMRDEAEIRGHRRTYVGALPGRILQSLRRWKAATR